MRFLKLLLVFFSKFWIFIRKKVIFKRFLYSPSQVRKRLQILAFFDLFKMDLTASRRSKFCFRVRVLYFYPHCSTWTTSVKPRLSEKGPKRLEIIGKPWAFSKLSSHSLCRVEKAQVWLYRWCIVLSGKCKRETSYNCSFVCTRGLRKFLKLIQASFDAKV